MDLKSATPRGFEGRGGTGHLAVSRALLVAPFGLDLVAQTRCDGVYEITGRVGLRRASACAARCEPH